MLFQIARISVKGMTCAACSGAVERALLAINGVVRASVSLTQGVAEVVMQHAKLVRDVMAPVPTMLMMLSFPQGDIVEAIEDAGFDAKVISSGPPTSMESVLIKVCGTI